MALLKDAKEIQIPDSRYRQLEYIHFSGAEAVNAWIQLPAGTGYKRIEMECRYNQLTAWCGNGYYAAGSDNRCLLGLGGSSKTQYAIGSMYTYQDSDAIAIPANEWTYWLLWSNSGSTNLSVYYGPGESSLIGTTNTRSYTFGSASGRLYVGAYNNNGTLAGYCNMDLKTFRVRLNSYGNIAFNGIPCQRKSDGVCGLFDIISGTFRAMEGTAITTAAAGPTVQEFIDAPVNKIEDSNGNIIWGSQSAFPYRRLEYIHFNGSDNYLDPAVATKQGYYRMFQFDIERNNIRQETFCCYDGTANDALRRYYVFDIQPTTSTNGIRACCGSVWTSAVATSNVPLNTKLQAAAVNSTVSNKPRMQLNLKNVVAGTFVIPTTTINGTTNGTLSTLTPYLMGCHTKNASSDYLENPAQGKVYYFEERAGTYQGNLTKCQIPVQRKSDGKVGLYDTINNSFHIMQGTQDSTSVGPILDEYWDLVDPFH